MKNSKSILFFFSAILVTFCSKKIIDKNNEYSYVIVTMEIKNCIKKGEKLNTIYFNISNNSSEKLILNHENFLLSKITDLKGNNLYPISLIEYSSPNHGIIEIKENSKRVISIKSDIFNNYNLIIGEKYFLNAFYITKFNRHRDKKMIIVEPLKFTVCKL